MTVYTVLCTFSLGITVLSFSFPRTVLVMFRHIWTGLRYALIVEASGSIYRCLHRESATGVSSGARNEVGSPSYPTDSAGTIWVLDTHLKHWTQSTGDLAAGPWLCRHLSLWPQAGCEWSLSGAFSCLFVSSPQCSQQELHGMVIKFLPNTWEWGEERCGLFLAELFYIKIVTFRLLLPTSWHIFRRKPINLGIFGWQKIPFSQYKWVCCMIVLCSCYCCFEDTHNLLWKLFIACVTIVIEYFLERWDPFQAKQMFLNTFSLNGGVISWKQ